MPTQTFWIDEPDILGVEYDKYITVDEINAMMQECIAIADEQPVYFMVDVTNTVLIPRNIFKIQGLTQLIRHRNSRWFAFVGGNELVKFAMQVSFRNRNTMRAFNNQDEAIAFLRDVVQNDKKAAEENNNAQ